MAWFRRKRSLAFIAPQDTGSGIGLALSGGAARGMAHIGVLKALQENHIEIGFLSGTSIGALVAALYAFGIPLEDIRRKAEELSWSRISSLKISRSGLLSNQEIGDLVEEFIGNANIEDAAIPLAIVTTDIASGKKEILRSGNVSRAVRASTSIPGIFVPVKINDKLLVDGFLVENLPLSPLRDMGARVLVGVNLAKLKEYREPSGMINIILNAFDIAIDANTLLNIEDADVVITPRPGEISLTESARPAVFYEQGYRAAALAIPEIRKTIRRKHTGTAASAWQRIKRYFSRQSPSP